MTTERHETGLEIAVVGMAGRFPGAPTVESLWQNLRRGVESVRFFDDAELLAAGVPAERLADPRYVKASATVDGIEEFDPAFFDYAPREAAVIDPQHRLFLQCSWHALEAAGAAAGDRVVGVYAGANQNTYLFVHLLSNPRLVASLGTAAISLASQNDFLATRVAYKLDLEGPAVSVQTACSTSLVAVHMACQGLLAGDCDVALAGGVSLKVPQVAGRVHQPGGIQSPDGYCRPFDARAEGTVHGDGVGVVALKLLDDARADGDRIHGVIKGTAINNDGARKAGFTAPRRDGQARVVRNAQLRAQVEPDSIGYVEAHGTATPLGDPIEVAALHRAFEGVPPGERCALGSLKSNLGHLDAAAGVAGLIKAVLAVEHGEIPPSLHFETPNPKIDFAAGPFFVPRTLIPWPAEGGPRRAAVSSFGLGGTNAHAVLEEAPPRPPSGPSRRRQLLLVSARSPEALGRLASDLAARLETADGGDEADDTFLADACHSLRVGRRRFEERRAAVVADRAEAVAVLRGRRPELETAGRREGGERRVVFLLPGQGAQHPGMGRELYRTEAVFRRSLDRAADHLEPLLGLDLRQLLVAADPTDRTAAARLEDTRLAQPALFAVEHALAELWISWGVEPWAMIGHSLGELVAATLAGVMSLDAALDAVAERGRLMAEQPPGSMVSVDLSAGGAEELLSATGLADRVVLAAVNGPSLVTLAGAAEAVDALVAACAAREIRHRLLHTSHAFHTPAMEPAREAFARWLAGRELAAPRRPYVSNLTGDWADAALATDPVAWGDHLRRPVRFADGIARLLAQPAVVFLEVGPGRTLGDLVARNAAPDGPRPVTVASLARPRDGADADLTVLRAAGRLWLEGVDLDWHRFVDGEDRRRVPLPLYPFARERCWIEPGEAPFAAVAAAATAGTAATAVDGTRDEGAAPTVPAAPPAGPASAVDDLEGFLLELWRDLLGVAELGLHDDFFDLGGHSLLATRVTGRLREATGVELPLDSLFEAPTVARLAERVREHQTTGDVPGDGGTIPRLHRRQGGGAVPLSWAQQQIWVLQTLAPASPAYNLPAAFELQGALDGELVARALARVVERHEVIRATFAPGDDGWPRQSFGPPSSVTLERVDLTGLPPAERPTAARALATRLTHTVMDLEARPAFRAVLARGGDAHHWLILVAHHAIFDGWSFGVLYRELAVAYEALARGEEPRLPELPIQYADYALWQRQRLDDDAFARRLDRCRRRLAAVRPLGLGEGADGGGGDVGRSEPWSLDGETLGRLERLARTAGATPYQATLALFALVLGRWTERRDVAVGSPVAGRLRPETELLVGDFVNTMVVGLDLDRLAGTAPVSDLWSLVRRQVLDAQADQEVPYERVASAVREDSGRSELFDVWFVLHDTPSPRLDLPGLELSRLDPGDLPARHPLSLHLWRAANGLSGLFIHRPGALGRDGVRALGEALDAAVRRVVETPDIPLVELERAIDRSLEARRSATRRQLKTRGLHKMRAARRETVAPTSEETR